MINSDDIFSPKVKEDRDGKKDKGKIRQSAFFDDGLVQHEPCFALRRNRTLRGNDIMPHEALEGVRIHSYLLEVFEYSIGPPPFGPCSHLGLTQQTFAFLLKPTQMTQCFLRSSVSDVKHYCRPT
jgi:hypothetical protein